MADDVKTPQPPPTEYDWDFFLAHAGPDLNVAKMLKRELEPPARAFLDDDNLIPGDSFDQELAAAQQSSLISVVIVSPNTERAYYQRVEIAAAIQMAEEDPHTHRVVPIFLNATKLPSRLPYGLNIKHGLRVGDSSDLAGAGERLLKTLTAMKHYEKKRVEVVAEQRAELERFERGNGVKDTLLWLARPSQMNLVVLIVFLVMLFIAFGMLIVSLWWDVPPDIRSLIVYALLAIIVLFVGCILFVVRQNGNAAIQIGQGKVNGG